MKKETVKAKVQKAPIDPVKELEKAQRKIKKLQKQSKTYYAWYEDENKQKVKAVQAYNESQLVAKLYKERADDYYNRYSKMLEERIGEARQRLDQQLKEIDYRLGKVKPWGHDGDDVKKPQIDNTQSLRILCIETGPIEYVLYDGTKEIRTGEAAPLEYCEVYTTPGARINEDGVIVFPINEFGGTCMLAQRFAILEQK